ncbi:MAG: hypothetical protein Q8S04_09845 [Bacteroidales bacterium]|nr:hypothetical protein [Bacteroidales bacterium]
MIRKLFISLTLLFVISSALIAQDALTLSLASFNKWSKVVSNTGYPLTESFNDGKVEFRAKFMLSMEKAFIVRVTPLSSFEPLISTLHNFERYLWNGYNVVYGNVNNTTFLIIEVPENKLIFSIKVEEKMKKLDLEELAENVKFKQLKPVAAPVKK